MGNPVLIVLIVFYDYKKKIAYLAHTMMKHFYCWITKSIFLREMSFELVLPWERELIPDLVENSKRANRIVTYN